MTKSLHFPQAEFPGYIPPEMPAADVQPRRRGRIIAASAVATLLATGAGATPFLLHHGKGPAKKSGTTGPARPGLPVLPGASPTRTESAAPSPAPSSQAPPAPKYDRVTAPSDVTCTSLQVERGPNGTTILIPGVNIKPGRHPDPNRFVTFVDYVAGTNPGDKIANNLGDEGHFPIIQHGLGRITLPVPPEALHFGGKDSMFAPVNIRYYAGDQPPDTDKNAYAVIGTQLVGHLAQYPGSIDSCGEAVQAEQRPNHRLDFPPVEFPG